MTVQAISTIKEWLKEENIPAEDKTIKTFLAGCKGNAELAKQKIRNYHKMKTTWDWFKNRDPENDSIRNLLELGVMLPVPAKDEQGRTLIIVRATINNPKVNPMSEVFKVGMMVIDLMMEEEESITRNGVSVVIDLEGVALGHALQMTPGVVKRAVHSWQDCYPIRIKNIDFVNCPPHVNVVLNLFRRFMREKLRKRIRTHGKGNFQLGDFHDVKCLPYEYGGSYGPIASVVNHWAEKVRSNRHWFLTN